MKCISTLGFGLLFGALALGAEVIEPEVVGNPSSLDPHRWTGIVSLERGGRASGVVVAPRVYATAAHVVYENGWIPRAEIEFVVAHHSASVPEGIRAIATQRWTSYATRTEADTAGDGKSSIDTFNVDFAAVMVAQNLLGNGSFARTFVDEPDAISLLRQSRNKTIIGYPQTGVPLINRNRMHATPPGPYETYWWAQDDQPLSQRDSENLWFASYYFVDVVTVGGNSGGPVFVEGNDGRYLLNALLVGGTETSSTVRGIDAAAWEWVDAAAGQSGARPLRRVSDLEAVPAADRVVLAWTDSSPGESAYVVERRDHAEYSTVALLPANSQGYVDTEVKPGTTYQYRVHPVDAAGNMAPPSGPVLAEIPGPNRELAAALGEPWLYFVSRGDAPMVARDGAVESGKVWSMERSALELSLYGPGQLTFTWSVSSEENPDYDSITSANYREIYDALFLFEDGARLDFLSGFEAPRVRTINVPAGPHTYVWEYAKDPYSDEGEDLGRLSSVSWTPLGLGGDLYGARERDARWRETAWFGAYTGDWLPWAFHEEMGWLYLQRITAERTWAYHSNPALGWLYLTPESYPFVYSGSAGRWFYYLRGSAVLGGPGWYYDLTGGSWREL